MCKNNKDMSRDMEEVMEYERLCGQVLADIDALLPMLDGEAQTLLWRILKNQSRITEISVGDSFMEGVIVAGCIMREEEE